MAVEIVDYANNDVVIESYCEAEVCTCKLIIFLKIIKENLAPTGKILLYNACHLPLKIQLPEIGKCIFENTKEKKNNVLSPKVAP